MMLCIYGSLLRACWVVNKLWSKSAIPLWVANLLRHLPIYSPGPFEAVNNLRITGLNLGVTLGFSSVSIL